MPPTADTETRDQPETNGVRLIGAESDRAIRTYRKPAVAMTRDRPNCPELEPIPETATAEGL